MKLRPTEAFLPSLNFSFTGRFFTVLSVLLIGETETPSRLETRSQHMAANKEAPLKRQRFQFVEDEILKEMVLPQSVASSRYAFFSGCRRRSDSSLGDRADFCFASCSSLLPHRGPQPAAPWTSHRNCSHLPFRMAHIRSWNNLQNNGKRRRRTSQIWEWSSPQPSRLSRSDVAH
jgi:hypothetical protein